MMLSSTYLVATIAFAHLAYGIPVDNAVIGDPEISCDADGIGINIATRNAFGGHIYVKNKYDASGCRQSGDSTTASAQMKLAYDQGEACLVSRTRSANPKGIFSSVTVIVSFHPAFLTKVDRAYTIQCFYMEADKTVSTDIEVSMLTTGFQTQFVPMPVCRYEIRDGGPDGEIVDFAIIGQPVYHKWICDTDTVDTFCMRVHTCYVEDGTNDRVNLIGEDGCALDRYLINNLEYPTDLMAGVEAHVFKYADRPALFFQCQITIDVKPTCETPGGNGDGSNTGVDLGASSPSAAAAVILAPVEIADAPVEVVEEVVEDVADVVADEVVVDEVVDEEATGDSAALFTRFRVRRGVVSTNTVAVVDVRTDIQPVDIAVQTPSSLQSRFNHSDRVFARTAPSRDVCVTMPVIVAALAIMLAAATVTVVLAVRRPTKL